MAKGTKWLLISDGVILVVALAVIAGFYLGFIQVQSLKNSSALLSDRVAVLEADLGITAETSRQLSQQLKDQQEKVENFEDAVDDIEGTVNTLEKLSKTDKELLQKYSRVYFLSENYVPLRLSEIDEEFVKDPNKTLEFHSSARSYLEDMLEAAQRKDLDIKIVSAYRSFGTQSSLKASYLTTYGTGSNQFSADQGYSEHQLGTAVDLSFVGDPAPLMTAFENTKEFAWLKDNAYKYGFILSYPKNNAYYQYEPWHWRFVGVKLATKLYRDGINFSDMDQREIDTYLVKIFD